MLICNYCKYEIENEESAYYCIICGAVVCCGCISDDENVCSDCVE